MKSLFRMTALLTLSLVVFGCGGATVSSDYDTSKDFSQYKTFAWVDDSQVEASYDLQGLLHDRIHAAVKTELEAKGLTEATENPDLLLAYHTGKQDQTQIDSWGYGYWGPRSVDTYTYTTGTLIIDLVDAESQQLAWRGTAEDIIDPNPSPEKSQENINKAVAKIFSKYPPQ